MNHITTTEVQVRRRAEWAIVSFEMPTLDPEKTPHALLNLKDSSLCLDLYFPPIVGAVYHYADRQWMITSIGIFPTKKGSRQKKMMPQVMFKLITD